MHKYLIILSLLGLLIGIPAFAQSGDACNIEAPAEPVELQLISWPFAITEFYAAEMEACSEVDNLTINVNLIDSTSLQEQVRLALSTGGDSPYDIVHGANGQVSEWGAPGWVMPLNDLVDKYRDQYNLDDIPQSAWDDATLDGNILGVPAVGNTLHLVYRADVFEANDWAVPDTYEELWALCDTIGFDNMDWELPFALDVSRARAWELEFFMLLRALGGDYLGDDLMPTFNNDIGVEAVDMFKQLWEPSGLLTWLYQQLTSTRFRMNETSVKTLIVFFGIWYVTPFTIVVYFAGLQTLPQEMIEAASIDGAGRLQKIRHIVIPYVSSLTVFILLFSIMDSYRVFDSVYVLSGLNPQFKADTVMTYTFATAVQVQRLGKANAMAILTVIGIMVVLIPFLRLMYKEQIAER